MYAIRSESSVRILIDALSVVPGETGGGETYIQELVNALGEVDHRNNYLVLVSPDSLHLFADLGQNFSFLTVKINNRLRPVRVLYEQLYLPVLARRWGANVIHFPGNIISLTCSLLGIPSVVTIQDASPLFYLSNFPSYVRKLRTRILIFLTRYAAKHSHAVITATKFSQREICTWTNVSAHKVFVVPHGCPHKSDLNVDQASTLRRYGLVQPYVVIVGRANKHKNLDFFVRAFAQAKRTYNFPHQLVIAGPAGSGHIDLLASVAESRAEHFVRLIGYVPANDLPAIYQSSDLFAMPSLYEGFGFPVLEAMQLGVPTLLSSAASLPEVGGDAAVYVDPRDLTSIGTMLGKVLTDDALRRRLGDRGKIQAAKFSWQKTALETIAVYEKVMEEAKARARH
jgi:glycosyltransferase involved in cell wall biosynthesis